MMKDKLSSISIITPILSNQIKENGKPAFAKGRSPIKDKRVEYTFKDIPCGEYAIKLYHDTNMNQALDKNFLNIPKEQYGFSNCKELHTSS